ncbi:hybrid sensor histidine kinase/response regulator [Leptolyngbya sp. BL0902]|uniref:hybrid sensor histidine kinase/response regulator n=1 Tax=Leptolyngbya sp. BL0902 TaxID=1115757 RepID=UPI0018E739A9|nr:response regulator [Leptolyngbya sp. BL0902]QQE64230.1 hybrid sensor histidine kinase/response regulator [Leptolyngbya sp. BL0902]
MKKILVIEDDLQVQDNIYDILSLEDFYTITASDGAEGLMLAQEERPDLIICDIMMPQMDGYAVLAALRADENTAAIPFIFLTAKADRDDLRQGMALGADDYLTKPFTPDELRQSINARLARLESQQQQTQRQVDQLRDTISYALPYELNTPLVGIINGAHLLRTSYASMDKAEIEELLGDIETSGNRLYALIQNFITYADLELAIANPETADKLRARTEPCLTAPVITAAAVQRAKAVNREADLHLELQDAYVQISDWRLKKAVQEVVDNAFKFSPAGNPVKVISHVKDDHLHIFVIDQGRGMDADQIEAIGAYMQFQRRLYERPGSGLGLAIAKLTMALYGGELNIESFVGQQTTVRLTLPTAQDINIAHRADDTSA